MSNRTISLLSFLVVICAVALFLNRLAYFFPEDTIDRYLDPNEVRGMAIEQQGDLYTLNLEQQSVILGLLNRSVPAPKKIREQSLEDAGFSRIIIYCFDLPDQEIIPFGYQEDNLIFHAPEWNQESPLQDVSNGKLKKLLFQTYFP